MSEKRFMLDDAGELIDKETAQFLEYGEKVCELLNNLHEENRTYKKKIGIMADAFAQSNDLIEIEQVFYTKVYEPSEYYDEETLSTITNALLGSDVE